MKKILFTLFFYIFLFLVAYLLITDGYLTVEYILSNQDNHYLLAFIFYCFFTLVLVLLLPLSLVFLLLSGVIWGAANGSLLSLCATTTAAIISFLIARSHQENILLRFIKNKISDKNIDLPKEHIYKYVILTTINPLLPQAVFNYLFGFTKIKFKTFITANVTASCVMNFVYASIGSNFKILMLTPNIKILLYIIGSLVFILTISFMFSDYKKIINKYD